MATIRREQLAAVNINYRMYPFQDFLDTQRELGMKTIELWAGAPHFLMDYQQRPDCAALRAEIESRELRVAALTPESALYQFPVAAYNEEVQKLAIPYYTNALKSAQELGAAAVGVNCSVGPDQLEAVIRTLAEAASAPVVAKPNAGLPVMDAQGQAIYSMGPRDFARHMAVLARAGASLLGGCCGSTPDYIRALAEVL